MKKKKVKIILGIETSCDETASAIVKDGKHVISSTIASSQEMHTKTGGIIPEMAARQQLVSMIPVIQETLDKAKMTSNDIDAIAVTSGPGLIGSLLVGVETAKTLSYVWKIPVVPVNHLVGHIYANWLEQETSPIFPALSLVVSGGHTDLVLMKNHGEFSYIGGTRDDAAGEAFDKTARLLGLGYPGGPAISKNAKNVGNKKLTMFPRPMIDSDNFDWSFSGLKTSVLTKTQKDDSVDIAEYSAQIQEAIVDVLVTKTLKAVKRYKPKSLLLSGGVAANDRLKEQFVENIKKESVEVDFFVPPPNLCTDNASYIASAAYFNYKPIDWKKTIANPQLTITDSV